MAVLNVVAHAVSESIEPRTALHWYDFVCPFCYIGQHRTALLERQGLQIVELPFQVDPDIPTSGIAIGLRTGPMYERLEHEARAAGLVLRWPIRLPNTRRALAAADWVRRHRPRKFAQLHRRLFDAHFVLGQDLGDPLVIDLHAGEAGVDLAALDAALDDGSAMAGVVEAEALGRQWGVRATPAWLVEQRLIEGLLPVAEFERLANPFE